MIPAHNEGSGLVQTIRSILQTRTLNGSLEIVIADDCSVDGSTAAAQAAFPHIAIKVVPTGGRAGVARSRNLAARESSGDILFITDGHVQFSPGWDELILQQVRPSVILAATIADLDTAFCAYGCRLVVPFMGTHWNGKPPADLCETQIASAAGTVIYRQDFQRLGGYDDGMLIYGGAEPEFSVRAWLSGFRICSVPSLIVSHQFKPEKARNDLLAARRLFIVHNSLRFGMLYLGNTMILKMLRYLAWEFPAYAGEAFRMVESSDVFERRNYLEEKLTYDFAWFVDRFHLKDQAGEPIDID